MEIVEHLCRYLAISSPTDGTDHRWKGQGLRTAPIMCHSATRIPGYPSYVSVLVAAAHVISDEVADVICALNSPPPSGRTACQFLRRTAICRRASLRCRPYSPSLRNIVPSSRHAGWDRHLLKASHAAYQSSRERNPRRWRGNTRNWTPVGVVTLNPERDAYVQAAGSQIQLSGSIGEPTFPS